VTTTTLHPDPSVAELNAMPDEQLGVDWLRVALRQALALELATIPPYSCGLWSIVDKRAGDAVYRPIREVLFDEMSHFALVGNMLAAIGGTPEPVAVAPSYPGRLPGGVRPELEVRLSGLTRASLDMYSQIEEPDQPIVAIAADEGGNSIGAFLRKIERVFRTLDPAEIRPVRQIEFDLSARHGNKIVAMTDLDTVLHSLEIIAEQGEGTTSSPENPFPLEPGELSHFYVFRELYHGRRLERDARGMWTFTGDLVALPRTYAAAEVPAGGWCADQYNAPPALAVKDALDGFNLSYSDMLREFQAAWAADEPGERAGHVDTAIRSMAEMRDQAREIMRIPLPDGSGWHYCPEFRYVPR
jgi:Ferritin-like